MSMDAEQQHKRWRSMLDDAAVDWDNDVMAVLYMIADQALDELAANAPTVAAAKAWGVACRTRSEGIAVDEVDLGARAAAARTLHTLLELVDPGKET